MEGTLIPFPARGRGPATARAGQPTSAPQAARQPAPDAGSVCCVASLELRRIPESGDTMTGPAVRRARDRCVREAVEALAAAGCSVMVAGTAAHPLVEARLEGAGAPERTARAALAAAGAVHSAQRAGERAFVLGGALAVGRVRTTGRGIRVAGGGAAVLADRLAERAAPGQLLLGGGAWAELGDELETAPAPSLEVGPGRSEPVRILRDQPSGDGA